MNTPLFPTFRALHITVGNTLHSTLLSEYDTMAQPNLAAIAESSKPSMILRTFSQFGCCRVYLGTLFVVSEIEWWRDHVVLSSSSQDMKYK